MSKIWNYFTLSGRIAFCKECDYKKDFPPRAPTTTLATHLKSKHPEQHKQFLDQSTEVKEKSNKEKEKQMTLKRSFEIQSSSKEDNNEVTLKQMRIDLCAQTKSAWDKDGLKTLEVNRAIMEFIATDIQPFSVVQDSGFKRLIALLKLQYNLPSRNFFSEKMLPCIYESVKARVSDQSNSSSTKTCAVADLFNEYERDNEMENMLNTQLPSPAELNAHQKAEVEVNEYLHSKRLQITDDPFKYWSGENSIKWPLLTKLSHRYFSAPATSSESERLFSTAGLVVSNLRTRLLPDNVEKLLFLHNNLKIYDY
uniref:BED-type domain-containing protein n=1 Tax=Meloidogyne incognita TaxID=6306 RepID=A0A914NVB0_MELIC